MITTKEFKAFLADDERQILALKHDNLLKINAIDEETGENIPGVSYIGYVSLAMGVTPFSNYEKTEILGIYDEKNKKLYYKTIAAVRLNDNNLRNVLDEIGAINFTSLNRMVKKEIDRQLKEVYQDLDIEKIVERRTDPEEEFKQKFMNQRINDFFATGVKVYGKDSEYLTEEYLTELTAYDYVKIIEDKEYTSELAMKYLSSKDMFSDKTNLELNTEKYIYNQVKLKFERNIELSDNDKIILNLFENISKVDNARTVKMTYKQGHKSVELNIDVDTLKRYNYLSLVFNNYAFSSSAIKTMKGASDFRKMFRSEDNPFGDILVKGIKKVTYGRKTLYEVK